MIAISGSRGLRVSRKYYRFIRWEAKVLDYKVASLLLLS
jgi:hypothetical protein